MTTQTRDPQPLGRGGETAAVAIGTGILLLAGAALAGLGLAGALFGGGWVWPANVDAAAPILGGLLSGEPARGLPAAQQGLVPGPVAVYACIGVLELLTLTLGAVAGVLVSRYRRPSDARRGMATRDEATQVLGVGRLRSARTIIRPDLYGKQAKTSSGSSR